MMPTSKSLVLKRDSEVLTESRWSVRTFREPWSAFPRHQAKPQQARGLCQWGSPSGPWLDEGFLGTTGTNLGVPASLGPVETGLCFWSTPCCETESRIYLKTVALPHNETLMSSLWMCLRALFLNDIVIYYLRQYSGWSAADSMKGILSSSGFRKQQVCYMEELRSTLQTSHKTTKWTDLLIEPEEMAVNGQACERDWRKREERDGFQIQFKACMRYNEASCSVFILMGQKHPEH